MPHFVNEARAMSVLTVTLDSRPDELITPEPGILIPVSSSSSQRSAEVYDVAPEAPADVAERLVGSVAAPFCCLSCLLGNETDVLIGIAA